MSVIWKIDFFHAPTSCRIWNTQLLYIVLSVCKCEKLAWNKSSVGHITFLVKVELMLAQGLGFSPKSSWRLLTNTLNISYKTKIIIQNNYNYLHYLVNFFWMWPTLILLLKMGWKWTWPASILCMRISVLFRKLFKLIVIGLFGAVQGDEQIRIVHIFVSWFLELTWMSYTL